jgi:hypothetical protein
MLDQPHTDIGGALSEIHVACLTPWSVGGTALNTSISSPRSHQTRLQILHPQSRQDVLLP